MKLVGGGYCLGLGVSPFWGGVHPSAEISFISQKFSQPLLQEIHPSSAEYQPSVD